MLLRLFIVIALLIGAVFLTFIVITIKDLVLWHCSIKRDLKKISREKRLYSPQKQRAIALIEQKALILFKISDFTPNLLPELKTFITGVASCFHPDSKNPELKVSLGRILESVEKTAPGLDAICARPGFNRLSKTSLRKLLLFHQLRNSPEKSKKKTGLIRLLFNISTLSFARLLLIDLYLLAGQFAIDLYDDQIFLPSIDLPDDIEKALSELSRIKHRADDFPSDNLKELRNSLAGLTSVLKTEPDFNRLKDSLLKAAEITAEKHFPASDNPLGEACIGPLINRCLVLIKSCGKNNIFSASDTLLKLRLETIFIAGSVTDAFLPEPVRKILGKTGKIYGLFKWPLNIYLWASKGAFVKIAIDAGWYAGRKVIISLIFGRIFDRGCKELDMVYRLSSKI